MGGRLIRKRTALKNPELYFLNPYFEINFAHKQPRAVFTFSVKAIAVTHTPYYYYKTPAQQYFLHMRI